MFPPLRSREARRAALATVTGGGALSWHVYHAGGKRVRAVVTAGHPHAPKRPTPLLPLGPGGFTGPGHGTRPSPPHAACIDEDRTRSGAACAAPEGSGPNGGEGGIRTRGTLLYTRFPVVHLRPLGHLSKVGKVRRSGSTCATTGPEGGGEGGIRTHGKRKPTVDFESTAFDHSATSPKKSESISIRVLSSDGSAARQRTPSAAPRLHLPGRRPSP